MAEALHFKVYRCKDCGGNTVMPADYEASTVPCQCRPGERVAQERKAGG